MKKIIILLLAFASVLTVAAKPIINLAVYAKDGLKVLYALEEKPKITFTDADLIITTKGVEVSYPLKDMARLTYENKEVTEIKNLYDDKTSFTLNGESIIFPCLKTKDVVSLYATNGTLIFKKDISTDGEYAFSLSDVERGVYIVKVNSLTYKIMKK